MASIQDELSIFVMDKYLLPPRLLLFIIIDSISTVFIMKTFPHALALRHAIWAPALIHLDGDSENGASERAS